MPGPTAHLPRPFAVRDLDWVISSSFMLGEKPEPDLAVLPETKALLAKLYRDPAPLHAHLAAQKSLNLGRYFEQLVIFWLSQLPSVELVGSNIPLYRDKQSLGELDLIFRHGGKAYHWELAVKFYLNIGSGRDPADFVGPMLRDNLKRKLDRLSTHQLRLPGTPEGQELLERLGVKTLSSYAWVKGRLFQPAQHSAGSPPALPATISPDCPIGIWVLAQEKSAAPLPAFDCFRLLDKPTWFTGRFLCPEVTRGGRTALFTAARQKLEAEGRPVQASLMRDTEASDLTEVARIFITPESWPRLSVKAHDGNKLRD
ncbi:DUF1853 family protein [Sneathiella sp.]|uniref:DUF1853 family protein n=1 Tax=Sneathiella sp. TaxID=1964365 RepID=UPI00356300F0